MISQMEENDLLNEMYITNTFLFLNGGAPRECSYIPKGKGG